uniref:Interferon-induced transmembrane protein 3 n=1 Tax=Sciurus vulgaris TaxID=55149 RepID=A0A8D2CJL9_SCIVU
MPKLQEEHEVVMLGGPCSLAPVTTMVINMPSESSVHRHVVWSLFNTHLMNFCCLAFIAFIYSIKSRDRNTMGDITGVQVFAFTTKCLKLGNFLLIQFVFFFTSLIYQHH